MLPITFGKVAALIIAAAVTYGLLDPRLEAPSLEVWNLLSSYISSLMGLN
jgi:hypothetical protein